MGKGKAAKVIDVYGVQLTPKEFAFCNFFLQHQNATKAVIEAGYKVDGKKPRWVAYELLHRDRIKTYLAAQFNVSLIQEKTSAILDQIMTSDLGAIYVKSGNSFDIQKVYDAGVSHLIKKHKQKTSTRTDKSGAVTVTEIVEIEREDKLHAAEILAKIQGWIGKDVNRNIPEVTAAQKVRDRINKLKEQGINKKNNSKEII